jgi:glycosyltransferase involved in cell wall biosynthesis
MSDIVSFFVHNLGGNPVGRAIPIAKALERRGYNVEVLGFIFGKRDVYAPYRQEINAKIIRTTKKPVEFFHKAQRLARQAEGDIIYAFKPLMTTLAPALFAARIVKSRPLLLDVEDEEVYLNTVTSFQDVWMKILRGWRLATSWKYTRLLQLFRGSVGATTVVSTTLKERYGGTILRHGPDEHQFYPDRFGQPHQLREKWGLPTDRKLAFFIGTPKSHKGLPTLASAIASEKCRNWDLVLVGPEENPYAQAAEDRLNDRFHGLGIRPYHMTPELLSMADAVPVPQLPTPFAEAQVPAKLLDAMAMSRPIVASSVGDLPDILGRGDRGWLVPPGDRNALARGLRTVEEKSQEVEERGKRAREWYEQNASTRAVGKKLVRIIEETMEEWDK